MGPLPLIGPSYNLESRPASVQRTVNLMPVPLEPGNERTPWVFRDVPGLVSFDDPSVLIIYDHAGSSQTLDIPVGVTSITFEVWGGGGGGSVPNGGALGVGTNGGNAGYVTGSLAVDGPETLTIIVGGGGLCNEVATQAYGGGGFGCRSGAIGGVNRVGGGGGGRSAILRGATELATAPGGGGAGFVGAGGHGGGGSGTSGVGDGAGTEGTDVAGGTGGTPLTGSNIAVGQNGSAHQGGAGMPSPPPVDASNCTGGGGGGGHYGGGGGGASNVSGGGGGGGSAFVPAGGSTEAGSDAGPGGDESAYRGGCGAGGDIGQDGAHGRVVIRYQVSA